VGIKSVARSCPPVASRAPARARDAIQHTIPSPKTASPIELGAPWRAISPRHVAMLPASDRRSSGLPARHGLNAKGIASREEARERAERLRPVFAELAGLSRSRTASVLNERNVPAPEGGRWHAVTVARVQSRLG
jgi:hypothetical protein